uniref:SFRICE_040001 n=1 Tax=Spodoptera frugiperda TaxID=7108 RepID=A0A2H1X194_SPOFR
MFDCTAVAVAGQLAVVQRVASAIPARSNSLDMGINDCDQFSLIWSNLGFSNLKRIYGSVVPELKQNCS